jgi:hypothetical protein
MQRTLVLALLALPVLLMQAGAQDNKPAPPPGVDDAKVAAAIKKGVEYLKTKKDDQGEGKGSKLELILLTLVHAGVSEQDPVFEELFKKMIEGKLEFTYRTSLQAMILEEVERVKYQWRLHQCAQFLVDNQASTGQWGYGSPTIYAEDIPSTPTTSAPKNTASAGGKAIKDYGATAEAPIHRAKPPVKKRIKVEKKRDGAATDNSNSQYAALGIRACYDGGIDFPEEIIERGIKWWRGCQKDDKNVKEEPLELQGVFVPQGKKGATVASNLVMAAPQGWCYGKHDHPAYGSMTVGAIGALSIYLYVKDNDEGKKQSWKRDKDVQEGLQWLNKKFSVTYNPGPYEHAKDEKKENGPHQYYYYLYGLERAGMLYGTEQIGSHWWYPEGAKVLLAAQKADGSWEGVLNTCFAILFLRRATRPLVATEAAGTKK